VVGQRVSGDGHLLDETPFHIGTSNSGQRVTVLWDGAQYLVLAINTANGNPFELRARRVGRAGEPLDRDWIPISYLAQPWAGTGNGSDGVLVNGRPLIVYDRYFDEDATGNVRVRARFLDSPPPDPLDAGAPDAAAVDAAGDAGGPALSSPGGCSCRVGDRGGLALPLLALLLLQALRVRHQRRDR
jgi:MYXO-CTERM domain-containing protein